jgi:hypothetical protein
MLLKKKRLRVVLSDDVMETIVLGMYEFGPQPRASPFSVKPVAFHILNGRVSLPRSQAPVFQHLRMI